MSLKQVPVWLAVGLLATAIVCTTWAWGTGDTAAGLIGTASLISFVVVALAVDRASGRSGPLPFPKEIND